MAMSLVLRLGQKLCFCIRNKRYCTCCCPAPTQIDKNKLLVDELSAYLPDRRSELSAGVVRVSV
jgi:hypothetical protein